MPEGGAHEFRRIFSLVDELYAHLKAGRLQALADHLRDYAARVAGRLRQQGFGTDLPGTRRASLSVLTHEWPARSLWVLAGLRQALAPCGALPLQFQSGNSSLVTRRSRRLRGGFIPRRVIRGTAARGRALHGAARLLVQRAAPKQPVLELSERGQDRLHPFSITQSINSTEARMAVASNFDLRDQETGLTRQTSFY